MLFRVASARYNCEAALYNFVRGDNWLCSVATVPCIREKSANLRKHVRWIRSLNSTMRRKVRRYSAIFFSSIMRFCWQNFQPTVDAWETANGNARLD